MEHPTMRLVTAAAISTPSPGEAFYGQDAKYAGNQPLKSPKLIRISTGSKTNRAFFVQLTAKGKKAWSAIEKELAGEELSGSKAELLGNLEGFGKFLGGRVQRRSGSSSLTGCILNGI